MRTPLVVGIAVALALSGCSEKRGSEKLSGARNRSIPVYEPSKVEDREAASYQAGLDFGSLESFHAYRWTLWSPDPPGSVIAFYENLALPPEEDEESLEWDLDDEIEEAPSEVYFELPPGGSDSVSVWIDTGPAEKGGTRFQLRESVPAKSLDG
jgi:hypothetical protein